MIKKLDIYIVAMELDRASFEDGLIHTKETREAKWKARKKLWDLLKFDPLYLDKDQYLYEDKHLSSKG